MHVLRYVRHDKRLCIITDYRRRFPLPGNQLIASTAMRSTLPRAGVVYGFNFVCITPVVKP